jgi:quercetin dioxygenase-like cupin family protein
MRHNMSRKLEIHNYSDYMIGGDLSFAMHGSGGTGQPLVKDGAFAADMIRFSPGKGIPAHTHPGDHILVCLSGTGKLIFDGEIFPITIGTIYLVPGNVSHAILTDENDEELTLLSIANDHRPVESKERSNIIESNK